MSARRNRPLVALDRILPGVPDVVRAVAAFGLDAPFAPRFPEAVPAEEDWPGIWTALDEQRLWGLASAAVTAGAFPVTDLQGAEIVVRHEEAVGACLRLDRQAQSVAAALDAAGIDHRVLKGVAAACALYRPAGVRVYGDIDLLVRPVDFDAAVAVLMGLGGERHHREPHPGHVARFGKSAAFSLPGGWEVDLHRTFGLGPFGVVAAAHDLVGAGRPLAVGSSSLLMLEPEAMLVGAAFHAVLGADIRRLVPLRDVAELARPGRVDPVAAVALAGRWEVSAVLAAGVEAATRELGLAGDGVLVGWAGDYRPSRREQRWLDDLHDQGPGGERRRTRDLLEALPSARERLAFLRSTIWYPGAPSTADRLRRFSRGVLPGH